MKTKPIIHFTANYLLAPTNQLTVNLIGCGGTGSRVLTALAEISHSLIELGHPGLHVNLYDDKVVTTANLGRQRFARSELGLKKCVARINNINGFFGTNWKACPYQYNKENLSGFKNKGTANIFISCVDTVQARFDIAEILKKFEMTNFNERYRPYYWMDYGNSKDTGQLLLSTIGEIVQPKSKKYQTVGLLPFITDEFKTLLVQSEAEDNTPSCSLREALQKQDLFINPTLAQFGGEILWQLIRNKWIANRGIFLNLHDLKVNPIKINTPLSAPVIRTLIRKKTAA
ncbi:PRTRC system ThiF family protein [Pedobacter sp. WC2423]|uniref:PRTRC system ThiF family protein n=1 Tax=Pedobacter sp. WC2423 TaxID=3234142 RepID=UPI003466C729